MENESVEKTLPKKREKLNKYQILSIVLASVMVALALGVGIYFIVVNAAERDGGPVDIANRLTLENYEAITVGMTYKEVFDILGEGKRTGNTEASETEGKYKIYFLWENNSGQMIVVGVEVDGFERTEKLDQIADGIVFDKSEVDLLPA